MKRILPAVLASLLATTAFAAEKEEIQVASVATQEGTVLVNQGEEFVTVTEGQALKAGDRIMVMEGGAAEVTFVDGCVLPLTSGSLFNVPAVSTCASNTASIEKIGPAYAQAVGDSNDSGEPSTAVVSFWVGAALIAVVATAGGDGGPPLPPPPPVSP